MQPCCAHFQANVLTLMFMSTPISISYHHPYQPAPPVYITQPPKLSHEQKSRLIPCFQHEAQQYTHGYNHTRKPCQTQKKQKRSSLYLADIATSRQTVTPLKLFNTHHMPVEKLKTMQQRFNLTPCHVSYINQNHVMTSLNLSHQAVNMACFPETTAEVVTLDTTSLCNYA